MQSVCELCISFEMLICRGFWTILDHCRLLPLVYTFQIIVIKRGVGWGWGVKSLPHPPVYGSFFSRVNLVQNCYVNSVLDCFGKISLHFSEETRLDSSTVCVISCIFMIYKVLWSLWFNIEKELLFEESCP